MTPGEQGNLHFQEAIAFQSRLDRKHRKTNQPRFEKLILMLQDPGAAEYYHKLSQQYKDGLDLEGDAYILANGEYIIIGEQTNTEDGVGRLFLRPVKRDDGSIDIDSRVIILPKGSDSAFSVPNEKQRAELDPGISEDYRWLEEIFGATTVEMGKTLNGYNLLNTPDGVIGFNGETLLRDAANFKQKMNEAGLMARKKVAGSIAVQAALIFSLGSTKSDIEKKQAEGDNAGQAEIEDTFMSATEARINARVGKETAKKYFLKKVMRDAGLRDFRWIHA